MSRQEQGKHTHDCSYTAIFGTKNLNPKVLWFNKVDTEKGKQSPKSYDWLQHPECSTIISQRLLIWYEDSTYLNLNSPKSSKIPLDECSDVRVTWFIAMFACLRIWCLSKIKYCFLAMWNVTIAGPISMFNDRLCLVEAPLAAREEDYNAYKPNGPWQPKVSPRQLFLLFLESGYYLS